MSSMSGCSPAAGRGRGRLRVLEAIRRLGAGVTGRIVRRPGRPLTGCPLDAAVGPGWPDSAVGLARRRGAGTPGWTTVAPIGRLTRPYRPGRRTHRDKDLLL
jgi:hypothetical protein